MKMDLFDYTGITIAARFLSGNSLKHERQFQKHRYDPIGRDVLTYNLGGVCPRKDFTVLSIDNMDIADHGGAKNRRGGGSLEAPEPIQTSIPSRKFCAVCTLTVVVQGIPLHIG